MSHPRRQVSTENGGGGLAQGATQIIVRVKRPVGDALAPIPKGMTAPPKRSGVTTTRVP